MSESKLQDHELLVKHKETGKELVVSKSHYFNRSGEYEILEGDVGEFAGKPAFEFSAPPPKVTKEEAPVERKPKAKKVEPPKVG